VRKHCRRRRIDPDLNPVRLAMMSKPTAPADLESLRTIELMSLGALAAGRASPRDLRTLRRMVAIAAAMGRAGIGPEVLPLAQVIQSGALAPDDLVQALRDLLALYDQQREVASRADYERAISKVVVG
jgi:DNA-binding FadR family transcriptional regulator